MSDSEKPDVADNWPDGSGPLRLVPDPEQLIIDVAGFEGPLDLLLEMARRQKVDLAKISILALAEQYINFINQAKRMQLELAADYLVMAAWLAYLKSRLLVPDEADEDDIPAEELAAKLAFRLQRLDAMREASTQLMHRNLLGRDVYSRGAPQALMVETRAEYTDNLYDLLTAYATRRQRNVAHSNYAVHKQAVWSIKQARQTLEKLLGAMDEWGQFDQYLVEYLIDPEQRRSIIASSFSASLELVREGKLDMRQQQPFSTLYMRRSSNYVAAAGKE